MSYVDEVLERVKTKNAAEPEFRQAVEEVLESIRPVVTILRFRVINKKFFESHFVILIFVKC